MSIFIIYKTKREKVKRMKKCEINTDYNNLDVPKKMKEKKLTKENKNAALYESEDKMVSHPGHYQSENGLEVIDVIEAFTKDLTGVEATDTGNIIKYACRWHKKNGIQDLEKILWYTSHLIKKLKEKQ